MSPRPAPRALVLSACLITLLALADPSPPAARSQERRLVYLPAVQPPEVQVPARWVGEVGGGGSAVAFTGPAVYLGEGHRVVVVDRSVPGRLRRAGEVGPLGGPVRDLVVAGDRLLVAAGEGGLQVLDLASPLAPRPLGGDDTPGDARALTAAGTLVALADGPGGLRLFELDAGRFPVLVGVLDTIEDATDVALDDGLAYVTISGPRSAGLIVVDLADPARPVELGAVPLPDESLSVAVRGDRAFVATGEAGLLAVDVADPRRPAVALDIDPEDHAVQVEIAGSRAFVRGLMQLGFWTVDLDDLPAPGRIDLTELPLGATDLAPDGDELYVADNGAGLARFGSGEGSWRPLAQLDEAGGWFENVVVDGDRAHALVLTMGELASLGTGQDAVRGGLRVFGLESGVRPRELARQSPTASAWPRLICADGTRLVTLSSGDDLSDQRLVIVETSQPGPPVEVARLPVPDWQLDAAVCRDGLAYLSERPAPRPGGMTSSPALRVYDLRAEGGPRLVGRLEVAEDISTLDVDGERAFLVTNGSQSTTLWAITVANPARPRVLRTMVETTPLQVHALDVAGGFAYALSFRDGLRVFDVRDPARMRTVGRLALPFTAGVAVHGGLALIAAGPLGLQAIDIGDPAAPRLLATVDTPGEAMRLALSGRHAYVGDLYGGLQVFEVGGP